VAAEEQEVGDDAEQPAGDEVATEPGAQGHDDTGDDLDHTDGQHGLVGVARNEVVELRRQGSGSSS